MEKINIEKENCDKEQKESVNIAVGMAQSKNTQRYGEAASQILQAKKGLRVDSNGQQIEFRGRSLDEISHYKKGTGTLQQQKQVAKSQAGFSAELIEESRYNKEAILAGNSNRKRTTDGIGRTNDPQYDHVVIDNKGNVIQGSESQMKFYGIDGKGRYKVIEKIVKDPSWSRYDGRPIDVPSDQYDGAVRYAKKCAQDYRKQAQRVAEEGKNAKANELLSKADKYEKAAKAIRKSKVSSAEAVEARNNLNRFVTKEVAADCHHAGIESAKGAFVVSGVISMAQNLYAVGAGEKEMDDAVEDVIRTTLDSGVTAYEVAVGGTAIKSIMHSSKSQMARDLGMTGFPQMIALAVVETGKSMKRYALGEIDEEELLLELGEKGTGILAAGYGAASGAMAGAALGSVVPFIGTAIGATVGGFIGGMIGSSEGGILYRGAMEALQCERISGERRRVIESIAQKAIDENRKYQMLMEQYARANYYQREHQLKTMFQQLDKSLMDGDMDGYVQNLEGLGNIFGVKLKFGSFDEFDDFMRNENTVLVLN